MPRGRTITTILLLAALGLAGCGDSANETNDGTTFTQEPGPGQPGEFDRPLPETAGGDRETTSSRAAGGSSEAMAEDGVTAEGQADAGEHVAAPGDLDAPLPFAPTEPTRTEQRAFDPFNPWVDAAADPRSTFGLDVDTISYSRVREAVETGATIDPSGVRVEEVVNALDYAYETDPSEVFTLTADGARWPWGRDGESEVLRIGLATPPTTVRQPANLTFVIDTSGSMSPYLPLVKDSLAVLVKSLEPGRDTISIVTYETTATPLLPPTDVGEASTILGAIDRLSSAGSTNLADGLVLGYDQALSMTDGRDEATNRVVLLSDGIANTGVTDLEGILDLVADGTGSGVELLTVGFGSQGFNDRLMEQLADRGDGIAVYVDGLDRAHEVFAEDLSATLQTVARQARVQVVFDPKVVQDYRLLGYENRDIADDDFRDDTIDAGEIGAGHTVTAVYEVVLDPRLDDRDVDVDVARVDLRWLDPDSGEAVERSTGIPLATVDREWEAASASLRVAGTAAAWAEVLRDSPYATTRDPGDLADEAGRIATALERPELDEWARLVQASIAS